MIRVVNKLFYAINIEPMLTSIYLTCVSHFINTNSLIPVIQLFFVKAEMN